MMLQNVLNYIKIVLMICTMQLRQTPPTGAPPLGEKHENDVASEGENTN